MEIPTVLSNEPVIDRENAFLIYANFCGDVARASHALGLSPVALQRVVDEEGWALRIAPILELKKGTKPGDVERAMNRAISFVQAHRWKLFLERVLSSLFKMDKAQLDSYIMSEEVDVKTSRVIRRFNTRPLADLSAALEKAHALAYAALGDTASERAKRLDAIQVGEVDPNEMHAKLAQAMADVGASNTPRAMLFDAQVMQAEQLRVGEAHKVASLRPEEYNSDDH